MRIYYGWIVVAICSTILLLVMGTTVAVFGLFVLPVAEEFNLSRADVNTAFVVTNIGGAIFAPFIGRIADTFPVRRLMAIGALCYGFGLTALGLSHSIAISVAVLAIAMPMSIGGIGTFGAMTLVARWFELQRARAMALTVIGMSLGSVIMAPIVGIMIEGLGWRMTLMSLGSGFGLLFLVLIFFLREGPGPDDVEPNPSGIEVSSRAPAVHGQANDKPLSTKQIFQLPLFWLLAFAMASNMGLVQAIAISLIPMAQENGISVTASAGILSAMGVAGIVGKSVLAWIGDRMDKALVLAILLVAKAGIIALLPLPDGYALLLFFAALLGLVGGVMMPLFMALLADYVGGLSFGSANGLATFMIAIIGAIAMRVAGEIYDRTGSYDVMFFAFAAVMLVSAALMLACARISRGASVPAAA